MSRSKKRYSIFCENGPVRENMGVGAVLSTAEDGKSKVWILVKGKIYKNGWFRYWHNGKEGKAGLYHWHNLTGKPQEEMEGIIRKLNISTIEGCHPKPKCKISTYQRPTNIRRTVEYYERMIRNSRVVREYPVEPPHTIVLEAAVHTNGIAVMNPPTREGQPVGEEAATV